MAARIISSPAAPDLPRLITDRVIYFPVRHHSPVCALHLEWLIRNWKPQTILIEGPANFTPLIPLILHPKTTTPFAIYTNYVESAGTADDTGATQPQGPKRHAAYYPFCDYSPELVALRVGAAIGATPRFIDLDYASQACESDDPKQPDTPRTESLLDEWHLRRSRFLIELARRTGCRDHNDLWDHLFETQAARQTESRETVEKFIHDVATWCQLARVEMTESQLESDGTVAREAFMASAIVDALKETAGTILVVTGGFHTVALPRLVAAGAARPVRTAAPEGSSDAPCLIRYGFEQLDALNGYAAGMPSPHYYDQLWRALGKERTGKAFAEVAAKMFVEIGQLTRRKKMAAALSPADEIAALEQARRLAALRRHPGPTREDLLDGIRSCFVKGAMDAEGEFILSLVQHALGGTAIGDVPDEAGVPPIVSDFRASARRLRLNVDDSVKRKVSLDLYRKEAHRLSSRLLHQLDFLRVPFGALEAGPDFVTGAGLERLIEHWSVQWTPSTESRLIEVSVYGAAVEEAAASFLALAIGGLEEAGRSRCAKEGVTILVRALRMGLHRRVDTLFGLIERQVGEDASLVSLASALSQLELLWESREPLEARGLSGIPELIEVICERLGYLLRSLAETPPEAADEALNALMIMRAVLVHRRSDSALSLDLFHELLAGALARPNCPSMLSGGVAGMLHSDGRLDERDLVRLLRGSLNAAIARAEDQTSFLIGLLKTCRELAWRCPALVEALDELLAVWPDEEFVRRLPHLRLAFADLAPRQTDQVAEAAARARGGRQEEARPIESISESEMLEGTRADLLVKQGLAEDGLGSWVEGLENDSIGRGDVR